MTQINITRATENEKSILRNMMELYTYDFSEYDGADLNEHGLYGYQRLDHYWTDEGRHPFLIRVGDKLAGFVLVRQMLETEEQRYSIAEFFVMRKYRRMGVGTIAAHTIFDMFGPLWEVGQVRENAPATIFWRKIIDTYTNGDYTHLPEGYEHWDSGPCQHFRSRGVED